MIMLKREKNHIETEIFEANGVVINSNGLKGNTVFKLANVSSKIGQQKMPVFRSTSHNVPIIVHPACVISKSISFHI
jgi:hypothetical protein